jgi:hypothetical protein
MLTPLQLLSVGHKKPLAEPNPPGAFCCVDITLGGRQAQAEAAMIIAAAMLIPMLRRMVFIISRHVAAQSLCPAIYIIHRLTYQASARC